MAIYKKYFPIKQYLTECEKKYYFSIINKLDKNYTIVPQVGLRTIIYTSKIFKFHNELNKYIDFVIFDTNKFLPVLAIEINDKTHYEKEKRIERDTMVYDILNEINLPIKIFTNEEIQNKSFNDLFNITKNILDTIEKD